MSFSEDNTKNLLINPAMAVQIAEHFFGDHDPTFAKEDWVKANAILMKGTSADVWLSDLLTALTGSFRSLKDGPINPYHAITLDPGLNGRAAIVGRKEWIAANIKLLQEMGTSDWLWQLLDTLGVDPFAAE